ncbi:MAG TPA: alanine racemase C-terminal domain-containing protein, partial [Candidatus Polarisedimenticolia bacterium]
IVGRISMDLTTVDVTEIPGAGLDDEVIVLGEAGGERLGADQMAAWADTIPWEILCRLGARVPRVYLSRTGRKIVSRFETALASLPRGTVE